MLQRFPRLSLVAACIVLFVSMVINVAALGKMLACSHCWHVPPTQSLAGHFPRELPMELPLVAMTFEDTEHYNITAFGAWSEWNSLAYFPQGNPSVHLGSPAQEFNLSMFRQLECINTLRVALIYGPNAESGRCLNLLRQAVLCASDITLDALNSVVNGTLVGTDGSGSTHLCRDWTRVYAYFHENHED